MFTGIIEEKGTLSEKKETGDKFRLKFNANKILRSSEIGGSISVNGCCLTIVKKNPKSFSVHVIEETLRKTNLGTLTIGDEVNLERPLKAGGRLDGHFVLGHIDTTGKIEEIKVLSNSRFITISCPQKFKKFLVHSGSISVDGISLTVAGQSENSFKVGIIPHTWENTILSKKSIGYKVNLEFDILGKYAARIIEEKS